MADDEARDENRSQQLMELLGLSGGHWTVTNSPIGNGQVAECRRWLFLNDQESHSVVTKSPSRDETSRATARAQSLYRRETSFYRELSSHVATRTPRLLHVEYDDASDDFLLVLEDLSPATSVDQFTGVSVDQAAVALSELAGLHGPTSRRPDLFSASWLAGVGEELRPLYEAIVPGLFDTFLERYSSDLDEPTVQIVRRAKESLGAFGDFVPEVTTVIHGDYRTENLIFRGGGGRVPLAVVDWQTVSVGSPMLDVAYFLTTSMTTDDRVAHEQWLIDHYLEALAGHGVEISPDGARREFARYTLQPITMLVAASVIVERTERGDAMFLAMIRRAADAVEQWRAFEIVG